VGQGVIFDPEDQPDILTPLSHNGASRDEHSKNCGPFIPEQESPLQRPRPPERLQPPPRKRSFQNRWSQRLSSAVIINRNPNNFTNQRLTPLFFCAMPTFWIFFHRVTSPKNEDKIDYKVNLAIIFGTSHIMIDKVQLF